MGPEFPTMEHGNCHKESGCIPISPQESRRGTWPKNMAELHIDKKTERKAKPQAKPWKGFPTVGQAGKGLKPRLDPTKWLAFRRGWGPISKARTQFASLIQRHLHTPPLHTARCLIPDIPFVKKQKPTLV